MILEIYQLVEDGLLLVVMVFEVLLLELGLALLLSNMLILQQQGMQMNSVNYLFALLDLQDLKMVMKSLVDVDHQLVVFLVVVHLDLQQQQVLI